MTFFKTNIITLLSKLVCLASALFISIYIARFLGPSAKGIYYLLVQIVSILATISLFGIDSASIYHLGKGVKARHVVALSHFITIVISVLMTAGLLLAAKTDFLRSVLLEQNYGFLIVIAMVIPFMAIARLNSAIIMGFNRFLAFNILNIALFVIMAVNFIIFVVFARLELFGALISFASAYFLMSVVYIIVVFSSNRMREASKNTVNAKNLLGYGARIFLVPILLLILYRIDSFFLGYYVGASAVGVYSVALSFAELLLFIPESTGTILFPKLALAEPESVNNKFSLILRVSVMLTAGMAGLFFITIKYLLPFVYGNAYLASVRLTYVLLPGLVAMSGYYLFSSYFQAIGKPGFVAITLFVILAEKILLSYLLIPRLDLLGAAIATTVAYFTSFVVFLFAFQKRARFNMREMLVLKQSDINFIRNSLNNMFDFQK